MKLYLIYVSFISLKYLETDLRTLRMFLGFSGCQLLKIQKQLQKFMNCQQRLSYYPKIVSVVVHCVPEVHCLTLQAFQGQPTVTECFSCDTSVLKDDSVFIFRVRQSKETLRMNHYYSHVHVFLSLQSNSGEVPSVATLLK